MLCKCHWIVLYIVHFTAFCLGGPFFSGHGVYSVSYYWQGCQQGLETRGQGRTQGPQFCP